MKTYVCGQGYIGAPGFGLLTPGEVLTEAHVRALGEERLNELVKSHAVDIMVTRDEQQPVNMLDDRQNGGENGKKTDPESPETDPEAPEIDHSDEEGPVALQLPDDLVKDADEAKPVKASKAKTEERRKGK